jgi:type I restriction enzyme M protein
MARAKQSGKAASANGANLGFEAKLWLAADKLRNNMDAAEYRLSMRKCRKTTKTR